MDIVLSKLTIPLSSLQLLGISSLFIAQKVHYLIVIILNFDKLQGTECDFHGEKLFRVEFNHNLICKITNNHYDVDSIIEMELLIYKKLKWSLNYPVISDFLEIFLLALFEDYQELLNILEERVEFLLTESIFIKFKPSILAITCLADYFNECNFTDGLKSCAQIISDCGEYIHQDEFNECFELISEIFNRDKTMGKQLFTPEKKNIIINYLETTTNSKEFLLSEEENISGFCLDPK